MRTKHQAKKLARKLTQDGIPAVDLHGNLSQAQRDRNLGAFGAGDVRVLVATDVAARGVHVDDIELVVHVDPPNEHKAYLHRSGRTARAGSAGDVVTVCLPDQRRDVASLLRKAKISVAAMPVTPRSDAVTALVGERAEFVAPQPVKQQPARQGGGGGQRGSGRGRGAGRSGAPRGNGGSGEQRGARSGDRRRSHTSGGNRSGASGSTRQSTSGPRSGNVAETASHRRNNQQRRRAVRAAG